MDLFPTFDGDRPAYNPKLSSAMGAAVPANLAAPGGGIMPTPQPEGFPLPGGRKVDVPANPSPKGVWDERVAPWSAPVPDMAASAKRAQQQPRPARPAPGRTSAFGAARIPNGGGRAR